MLERLVESALLLKSQLCLVVESELEYICANSEISSLFLLLLFYFLTFVCFFVYVLKGRRLFEPMLRTVGLHV